MSTAVEQARPAPGRRLLEFGKRAVRLELRIYTSITRVIARRPAVEPGGSGHQYHRPILTILIIFIGLSALEIPIIDLIVHRWPAVRIGFLILGIWGLTWMIGFLCAFFARPHAVGPTGIAVRDGLEIDIPLPWDDIASVARQRHVDEPKTPRVTDAGAHGILSLRMQDETNIEIELERDTEVHLPGRAPKGGAHRVRVVRIWVDDVPAFLAAVREHMP